MLALLVNSCGGTSNGSYGTPVVTLTDSNGDFTSYNVTVTGITLTRTDGYAPPLPPFVSNYSERVDFTRLSDVAELLEAPAVAPGTYTSASITLDYTTAVISVDVNGQSQTATVVDASGKAITGVITVTVKFDSAPLVVTQGKSTRLALDFDLAASNTVNLSASPPTVTVKPFLVATATPVDTKPIRARGTFVAVNAGATSYVMNLRPLYDQQSILGALTVQTNAQTYFNVNGTAYSGAAGLAAMASLPVNTMAAAYGTLGDLSGITPGFNATAVYAGTSLESGLEDHVSGVVTARSGDTLTVHGANYAARFSTAPSFANNATVNVGSSTIVSEDGHAATGLGELSISVGQKIDASGQATVDSSGNVTLDATAGQVRLAPTSLWGSLNSATPGSMTVSLLALGDYAPSAFNFAGTGTASGSDAMAGSYVVNTGSTDESATAAGTLLKADGFVSAFGSAPPDFDATSVTPGSAVGSQLIVEWSNGGATAPFTSYTSAGLVVDLSNTNLGTTHLIRTGPASVDLTTLAASPLISFDPTTLQLAIGNATSLSVFNTAAGFLSQLTTTLNGSTAVFKLVAVGQYDAATNTFQASRINIALE